MTDVYIAEIQAWDPSSSSLKVLRYATRGFVTAPTDSPPNVFFDGRLVQPAAMQRDLFSSGTSSGRSRASYGDLVLANGDGLLDVLLTYGVDGRIVTLRRGPLGAAYPSGFVTIADNLTASQFTATQDTLTLKLRDRQFELDVPFQPNKYAGTNSLPNGLEGVPTDIQGQPKPRCFGVVKNVPAVCVNTAKLIYQVNDGPIASLDTVYDRGIQLGTALLFRKRAAPGVSAQYGVIMFGPGPGLWVAGSRLPNVIASSPDGIAWTARTLAGMGGGLESGAYGGGLYVVSDGTKVSHSSDGITWSAPVTPGGAFSAIGMTYAPGPALFVAVGAGGVIYTSPDGVTWTARTSGTTLQLTAVTVGNGVIVAVGNGSAVVSSFDAITWTVRAANYGVSTGTDLLAVTFGAAGFVAAGISLLTSSDGLTWTKRVAPFGGIVVNGLTFLSDQYLAVGNTGLFATSEDGIAWILGSTEAGTTNFLATAYDAASQTCVVGGDVLGASLLTGTAAAYADPAELQSDAYAPAAGQVLAYLGGGYFRLGSPPDGLVTADVTEGPVAGDRTAAQLFERLLADPLGDIVIPVSHDDVVALDLANSAPLGFWTKDETTYADVLDLVAGSVGAWWGLDRSGVARIQQFTAPSGTPVYAFTRADLKQPLQRVAMNDVTGGLTTWLSLLDYAHNYSVQTTDLAAGVTDDRRAFVALADRTVSAEDDTVLVAHLRAVQIEESSLIAAQADAQTEVNRRQTLRGVQRDRFQAVVPLTSETEVLDLGQVVSLATPRFGMGAGPSFRILGAAPDVQKRELTLQLWK